jgi:hypothetical protein
MQRDKAPLPSHPLPQGVDRQLAQADGDGAALAILPNHRGLDGLLQLEARRHAVEGRLAQRGRLSRLTRTSRV